jgi:hypothetical protein
MEYRTYTVKSKLIISLKTTENKWGWSLESDKNDVIIETSSEYEYMK